MSQSPAALHLQAPPPLPQLQPQPQSQQQPQSQSQSQSQSSAAAAAAALALADVCQGLTLLSVEVLCASRGERLPDPREDAVRAIFYAVADDRLADAARRQACAAGAPADFAATLVVGAILVDGAAPPADAAEAGEEAAEAWRQGRGGHGRRFRFDDEGHERLRGGAGLGARCLQATVRDEAALLWAFAALVREWDADVLVGWEAQQGSFGYLLERAAVLGVGLGAALSRTPAAAPDRRNGADRYGEAHDSGIWVTGRIVLNGWRITKGELKLSSYTQENVVWHALRVRAPHFPQHVLAQWWDGPGATAAAAPAAQPLPRAPPPPPGGPAAPMPTSMPAPTEPMTPPPERTLRRSRVADYMVSRAALTLQLLEHLDLVGRTSEMARLFGIDFFSVLTRGSQFRVEAVMMRVYRPLGFLAPSPTPAEVELQAAMRAIPLILEPQSRVFAAPVVVLDFQSLYPSIIIAYNMCFSTCLGRLAEREDRIAAKLGVEAYQPPLGALAAQYAGAGRGSAVRRGPALPPAAGAVPRPRPRRPDSVFITPRHGTLFAPWTARQGVLPRMLREILDTRVMIKAAMKGADVRADPVLTRVMHARQLALKLIANVTYGYTAASFSGRMPCAEIADAIVETGRNTLDRARRMVEAEPRWRAKVVYGDTDSLFVSLPGRSVEEALAIGEEIAARVTAVNPRPITLKMEKVYHPCVLVAKKRYAGLMVESLAQLRAQRAGLAPPVLDCKGLEMVRRDQCALTTSMMEASLRLLLGTLDLSQLRAYVVRQLEKVLEGRVAAGSFIFGKEVRLGTYSARGYHEPQGAIVARRAMAADRRAEPRYGERVPYLVVQGPPGAGLFEQVASPREFLRAAGGLRLNAAYYVQKCVVPSLDRVLKLAGADVAAWVAEMRRPIMRRVRAPAPPLAFPPQQPQQLPPPQPPRQPSAPAEVVIVDLSMSPPEASAPQAQQQQQPQQQQQQQPQVRDSRRFSDDCSECVVSTSIPHLSPHLAPTHAPNPARSAAAAAAAAALGLAGVLGPLRDHLRGRLARPVGRGLRRRGLWGRRRADALRRLRPERPGRPGRWRALRAAQPRHDDARPGAAARSAARARGAAANAHRRRRDGFRVPPASTLP